MGSEGQIQVPSIWQKLTRTLQVKGRTVAPELGAVVHPVAIVEDITTRTRYDITEKVSAAQNVQAAGAGLFSTVGIFNPLGSGILAVLDLIVMDSTALTTLLLSLENSDLFPGTGSASFYRDRRIDRNGSSVIRTMEGGNAAGGPNRPIFRASVTANTPIVLKDGLDIVLAPGTGVYIFASVVNQMVEGTMWWREIPEIP